MSKSTKIDALIADGWRVESRGDHFVTLVKGRRPNHVLHLILTVLTLGVWGLVWAGLTIFGGEKRQTVDVE